MATSELIKDTTQAWHKSIAVRLFLILLALFLILAGITYYVINEQARLEMNATSEEIIEHAGNEAVGGIVSDIFHVDGMALTAEKMTAGLPKQAELYTNTFGPTMKAADPTVISGGVWFEPNAFEQGLERKTFFWIRDENGNMQWDGQYDDPAKVPDPYYKDWWYTPAKYAKHNHCVWSRAYIDPVSQYPMLTCAKPLRNAANQFEGTITIDLQLSNLNKMIANWQKKTGGYIFLADLDNHFLTFPDDKLVKRPSKLNPKGDFMLVQAFADEQPEFKTIANALDKVNNSIVQKARQKDAKRLESIAHGILADTQKQKIAANEASMLAATMLNNETSNNQLQQSFLVEKIAIPYDFRLKQAATAYVFLMPYTNWKMVIIKPASETNALANNLISKLFRYLALGFLPAALLALLLIHKFFVNPLRQTSSSVQTLAGLIGERRYLELTDNKLNESKGGNEISVMASSMNQLIDRVVLNEGKLAEINLTLENKVLERTVALEDTLDELKSSQAQLIRSEKMVTLGQMVAGVAHEVNTPLTYVQTNLEMIDLTADDYETLFEAIDELKELLSQPKVENSQLKQALVKLLNTANEVQEDSPVSEMRQATKDSLFGVEQISELVVNMRDFARLDESKTKNVDLRECIKSSLMIAKNNIRHIDVKTKLPDIPLVSCSPSQINQVLLNLINNATQAMSPDRKPEIGISVAADSTHVYIGVQDNGIGMSPAVQARIFEPFFTTKKAGEGTGLGMAISQQIIEQHHGEISVTSQENVGTKFVIKLPINRVT